MCLASCGGSSGDDGDRWQDAPIVPELSGDAEQRFLEDVAVSDQHGYRPEVFAKVGDSNTELPGNLYGFACRPVEYGEHADLEPVVARYNQVRLPFDGAPGCEPVTSFSRLSAAARSGTYSVFPVTPIGDSPPPFGRPDAACSPEEIPVDCEIRLLKPRYTIIMTGTNDFNLDRDFTDLEPGAKAAERLALLVAKVRQAGSVPVLSNLPPMSLAEPDTEAADEAIELTNERLAALAESEDVPLINLWRAMEEDQMIDRGISADGVHLSVYGGESSPDVLANSVNLEEEALRYGANRRNLIWVQTLAALDRVAGG
ncbi:MAG: SGNH/GDSL hydrolase family protein [Actinomycetota bacterium]|nr:SGNH/GDSL hydrolase family protein [Actinomycetota bacterium]